MTTDNHPRVISLLTQLLESTKRLSESAADPEADIDALNRSRQEQLAELQQIFQLQADESGGISTSESSEAARLLRALHDQTLQCMENLRSSRNRIGDEMAALRQTQRAIRAYES